MQFLVNASFLLLSLWSLVDYGRRRGSLRRDVALLFGALGLLGLQNILLQELGLNWRGLKELGTFTLLLQPVLLLQVTAHLKPLRLGLRWGAWVAWLGALLSLLLVPNPLPTFLLLAVVGYFITLNILAALRFFWGGQRAGFSRQRLAWASMGSILFALALALAGTLSIWTSAPSILLPIAQAMVLGSSFSFYIAFLPPRFLIRIWQNQLLRVYLLRLAEETGPLEIRNYWRLLKGAFDRALGAGRMGLLQGSTEESKSLVPLEEVAGVGRDYLLPTDSAMRKPLSDTMPHGFFLEEKDLPQGWRGKRPVESWITRVPLSILSDLDRLELVIISAEPPLFYEDEQTLISLLVKQTEIGLRNLQLVEHLDAKSRNLEALVQELEAFSYSVSHDLRTPLRAIDGFSALLNEDYGSVLDAGATDYLARIRSETQRMGWLIDDLLGLSRISLQDLAIEEVDLSALVRELTVDWSRQAGGRPVNVSIEPQLKAWADPHLTRILLTNLLENAWKFSSRSDEVRVEFGKVPEADRPTFFIRDYGAGFDMKYVTKLFGAFQRLHSQHEFPGTGIGLGTVKRIILRHQGEVTAFGAPAHGATFTFSFGMDPKKGDSHENLQHTFS